MSTGKHFWSAICWYVSKFKCWIALTWPFLYHTPHLKKCALVHKDLQDDAARERESGVFQQQPLVTVAGGSESGEAR